VFWQIGSFFMINLCLVVIATQFSETKKRETERMWAERQRSNSNATLTSAEQPGSCYDEIIRYIAHLGRVLRRRFFVIWRRCIIRRRRLRRRRRHQQAEEGIDNVETVMMGVVSAHDIDGDNGVNSPRRLLRFDDQPTSRTTRSHRDAICTNGSPINTPTEDLKTTNVALSVNGQLASEKVDGNGRKRFCSSDSPSTDGGVCNSRFYIPISSVILSESDASIIHPYCNCLL